jgi:2-Cys peroxiredoxin 5
MVQVGDSIPSIELVEGNPGNKVNLATELASGSGIIVGVPAAFSKPPSIEPRYQLQVLHQ